MRLKTEWEILERIQVLEDIRASLINPESSIWIRATAKINALKWVLNGGSQ